MRKMIRKYKNKLLIASYLVTATFMQVPPLAVNATASGADVISSSLDSFYNIVAAFVSAVGAIITLWGVFEWGTSMQSNDGTMQANAFKRVGGGLVMILAPNIIQGFI